MHSHYRILILLLLFETKKKVSLHRRQIHRYHLKPDADVAVMFRVTVDPDTQETRLFKTNEFRFPATAKYRFTKLFSLLILHQNKPGFFPRQAIEVFKLLWFL
jgi:hypothetical protein